MKVLITGINGFVGSHLADYIIDKNLGEVYGTIRSKNPNLDNISHNLGKINRIECDLTDATRTFEIINKVRPDIIFHLAAQAFVPPSWEAPYQTINTNVIGTLNILEAVRKSKTGPTIHLAGTSEEYGLVNGNELPIKETNPLRPLSPYGVSKVAADMLCWQYYKSYGLKTIVTRAFNHTGPRRGIQYALSNWCYQIANAELNNGGKTIKVGNLNASRDFSDVRDIVRAYWLAVKKGKPGEVYNISSGKAFSMQKILELLLNKTKLKFAIEKSPDRIRPSDVENLLGDCTKFRNATEWKPEIPLEKTLEDLLNYWREKIKANKAQ